MKYRIAIHYNEDIKTSTYIILRIDKTAETLYRNIKEVGYLAIDNLEGAEVTIVPMHSIILIKQIETVKE